MTARFSEGYQKCRNTHWLNDHSLRNVDQETNWRGEKQSKPHNKPTPDRLKAKGHVIVPGWTTYPENVVRHPNRRTKKV